MDSRKRNKRSARKRSDRVRTKSTPDVGESENRNQLRRVLYKRDSKKRQQVKARNLNRYREKTGHSPKQPASARGLVLDGENVEVYVSNEEGDSPPVTAEVYSLPKAAEALGVSYQTMLHWIKSGNIPKPVIKDTSRGRDHYSKGELEIIRRCLVSHWRSYDYLASSHQSAIHDIWQRVEAYRKNYV